MDWTERDSLQLVYDHPRGRDIHFGDAVVVREGQEVCFTAGGKNYWLTKPDTYTLGHDDRTKGEILMAKLYGEDLNGLPPLLDTQVRFINISPMRLIPFLTEFLLEKIKILIHVSLKIDIQVIHVKSLLPAVEEQGERAIISSMLKEAFSEKLMEEMTRDLGSVGTPEAAAWLEKNGAAALEKAVNGAETIQKNGIEIQGIHDVYLHISTSLCPVCAAEVQYPEKTCPNGHSLIWCPTCRTPVNDKGFCVNRHQLVYCVYCGGFVESRDGQCLIHRRA